MYHISQRIRLGQELVENLRRLSMSGDWMKEACRQLYMADLAFNINKNPYCEETAHGLLTSFEEIITTALL